MTGLGSASIARKKTAKSWIALLTAGAVCFSGLAAGAWTPMPAQAADKLWTLAKAKSVAISMSDKIDNLQTKSQAKRAARQSAIDSIREKRRSMSTVRWSPLFNIKLPTKPNEAEEFEFEFKPKQLAYEISVIDHKIKDERLAISEKVSNTYIDILTAEEALQYGEKREKKLTETVAKLEAKQALGEASQQMVETAQKRLENTTTKKNNAASKYLRSKQKLSELMGDEIDVTTGYRFTDAFTTANMERKDIQVLQNAALDGDHTVFEAKTAEDSARTALEVNYSLYNSKYGAYMSRIDSYIQTALQGGKVNKRDFKAKFDIFKREIDEEWQGDYRFLFISFPKEWLKGAIDGIRYVEDDPYALYTAVLEYDSACKERKSAEKDLRSTVNDMYDNYAEAKKAYETANKSFKQAQSAMAADEVRYLMGELSKEEFETEESECEQLETEVNEARSNYSEVLYSYDRTTCGGVSAFMGRGTAVSLSPVIQKGLSYTLRPIVRNQEFVLTVNVPDDFAAKSGVTVTDFELRCDGKLVGTRTPVNRSMRHLTLTVNGVSKVAIRLYNGREFVDECEIDPTVYSASLELTKGYEKKDNKHVIGTFTTKNQMSTDTVEIIPSFNQEVIREEYESGHDAATYNLTAENGSFLNSDAKIKVESSFNYLAFIKSDLGKLTIHLYDSAEKEIGTAKFRPVSGEIIHEVTEQEAKRIAKVRETNQKLEQKAEEAKKAKEADDAARDEAREILEKLGLDTSDANIANARAHINELKYTLELAEKNSKLESEMAEVEVLRQQAKAGGLNTADLDKRMEAMKQQKDSQEKTMSKMTTFAKMRDASASKRIQVERLKSAVEADREYVAGAKKRLQESVASKEAQYAALRSKWEEEASKPNGQRDNKLADSLKKQVLEMGKSLKATKQELESCDHKAAVKREQIKINLDKLRALGEDVSRYE